MHHRVSKERIREYYYSSNTCAPRRRLSRAEGLPRSETHCAQRGAVCTWTVICNRGARARMHVQSALRAASRRVAESYPRFDGRAKILRRSTGFSLSLSLSSSPLGIRSRDIDRARQGKRASWLLRVHQPSRVFSATSALVSRMMILYNLGLTSYGLLN